MSSAASVEASVGEGANAPVAAWNRARWRSRGAVVQLGRLGAVLAAAIAFHGGNGPATVLVAGVFFVSLERAFAVTHAALGAVAPAAAGAVTGLAATLPLAFFVPALQLGPLELVATAFAACLIAAPVSHVLRTRVVGPLRVRAVGSAAVEYVAEQFPRGTSALEVVGVLEADAAPGDAVGLSDLVEHACGRVPPRLVAADWLAALPSRRPRSVASKRSFDIAVASLGLLLTAPLWPWIAIACIQTRGAVLFPQLRVGENGNLFTMYKFRTMRHGAEPPGTAVWAQPSDPRATFAGRFLRETHLDELPQLWNVLRGDMSIVGPRPERPEIVQLLEREIPHWACRHAVKPGLTGWAQVCQGHVADRDGSEAKLSYDLWYLRHRTVLLDLAICLRTVPSLVLRPGAR